MRTIHYSILLFLVVTSCSPAYVTTPSQATTPLAASPSPFVLTPTPETIGYFHGLPTMADIDEDRLPVVAWDDIPSLVETIKREPNPFSPDATDVNAHVSSVANSTEHLIALALGSENSVVSGAFKFDNGGVVLIWRMKNNNDTAGILLTYVGGAQGDIWGR